MAEIFICPPGTLKDRDKRALRAAGVIPIETEHSERCQFIKASEVVSSSDMLWAALDAVNVDKDGTAQSGGAQRKRLAMNLLAVVNAARNRQEPQP